MYVCMQVRATLESLVSTKQGEVVVLQRELEREKAGHEKAAREAQETRALWEAEVKTKSRLGLTLETMQKTIDESRAESQGLVSAVSVVYAIEGI